MHVVHDHWKLESGDLSEHQPWHYFKPVLKIVTNSGQGGTAGEAVKIRECPT